MPKKTSKRIAVISGGTGGIGRFVVEEFLNEGYKVVLLEHHKKHLKVFPQCQGFELNVAKEATVQSVIKKIINQHKKIDVLVNIAGVIGPIGKFHSNSLDLWKRVLDVNLFGTANLCHAVLPYMIKRKKGKIINFAGGGATQPFINFSAYAASKAAVVRFTENLAKEYEPFNLQINAVSPGLIKTKMLDDAIRAGAKIAGKEYYRRIVRAKKQGGDDPLIAAGLVVWLAGGNNQLTGRLIAAQWDGWQKWNQPEIKKINSGNLYTLRRIDSKHFYEKF